MHLFLLHKKSVKSCDGWLSGWHLKNANFSHGNVECSICNNKEYSLDMKNDQAAAAVGTNELPKTSNKLMEAKGKKIGSR